MILVIPVYSCAFHNTKAKSFKIAQNLSREYKEGIDCREYNQKRAPRLMTTAGDTYTVDLNVLFKGHPVVPLRQKPGYTRVYQGASLVEPTRLFWFSNQAYQTLPNVQKAWLTRAFLESLVSLVILRTRKTRL